MLNLETSHLMAQQLQKVLSIKLSYILQPNQHVFWKIQLAT